MGVCKEKLRLINAYVETTDKASVAVSALTKAMGDPDAFREALAISEHARKNTEAARMDLRNHTKEHGC